MKFPVQPIEYDENDRPRFVQNTIVRYLLDHGGFDMNKIAELAATGIFSREEQVQFAQLIGYSLSGFSELNYVSDADYDLAEAMSEHPEESAEQMELKVLRAHLGSVEEKARDLAVQVFNNHPDDLRGRYEGGY